MTLIHEFVLVKFHYLSNTSDQIHLKKISIFLCRLEFECIHKQVLVSRMVVFIFHSEWEVQKMSKCHDCVERNIHDYYGSSSSGSTWYNCQLRTQVFEQTGFAKWMRLPYTCWSFTSVKYPTLTRQINDYYMSRVFHSDITRVWEWSTRP